MTRGKALWALGVALTLIGMSVALVFSSWSYYSCHYGGNCDLALTFQTIAIFGGVLPFVTGLCLSIGGIAEEREKERRPATGVILSSGIMLIVTIVIVIALILAAVFINPLRLGVPMDLPSGPFLFLNYM
jgi:uncharacterized membrane protein YidH (DUF202 family)